MATRSPGSTTRPRARVVNDLLDSRWLRGLIFLLFLIAAFYVLSVTWTFLGGFLGTFADTLILFFLAWLIAALLRPVARRLEGLHPFGPKNTISHGMAANLAFLSLIVGIILLGLLIIPTLITQVSGTVRYLTDPTSSFQSDLAGWQKFGEDQLKNFGISPDSLNQFTSGLTSSAVTVGQGTLGFLAGLGGALANVIILLILAFIFISDGDRIGGSLLNIVPVRFREQTRLLTSSIEVSFSGFLRGQTLLGIIYGAAVLLISIPFNLPFGLLAAIVSAIFMLVPLVGYVAAYLPPVLITLLSPNAGNWWIVLIIVALIQAVIVNVVSPRIMSKSLGIHPLVFFLALLVGSKVGGVWGALFGVPIAGVLNVMFSQLFSSFIKDSNWFTQSPQGWQRVEGFEEDEVMAESDVIVESPVDRIKQAVAVNVSHGPEAQGVTIRTSTGSEPSSMTVSTNQSGDVNVNIPANQGFSTK